MNGQDFVATPMEPLGDGRYGATLPGWPAGTLVQFYVEGADGLGARSMFPAAGPASRALLRVDALELANAGPLHTLRLLMLPAEATHLHTRAYLMSNERVGITVVSDEQEVFYHAGIRLKSSMAGRPGRAGFNVRFDPMRRFRGVFDTVSIDRSGIANGAGQREILIDTLATIAGFDAGEYNDLGYIVAPLPQHNGTAILQLARFGDVFLENQYPPRGGDGTVYEYEVVYYQAGTHDGTPEGLKLPNPFRVSWSFLGDLGPDKENYRQTYTIKNNRSRDEFRYIMDFARAWSLPDPEFQARIVEVLDLDQWLEAFALVTLTGVVDNFGTGSQHNVQFYVRPWDRRILFFPHDLDFYRADPRFPIANSRDLRRLLAVPGAHRLFYGHLAALLDSAFNEAVLRRWADHFGALLPGQPFGSHYDFTAARARWIRSEAPDALETVYPPVDFALEEVALQGADVALSGHAWVDVQGLRYEDGPAIDVQFDGTTWSALLPVGPGHNDIRLVATGLDGQPVERFTVDVEVPDADP